jgi:4-hydroxy-tetrahydrodipicolinate reductase
MRVAVVGLGRMGRSVLAAAERRGHEVVLAIGREGNEGGAALTPERLTGLDVAFEFTGPDSAAANLTRMALPGLAVVTGTTGWTTELPRLAELYRRRGSALLHAANFSIGMHLTRHAARTLARLLHRFPDYDAALRDIHHARKLDAPSGTALALQADCRAADPGRPWPIASERIGTVPGTHALIVDGPGESITLTHTVRDRAVFAEGAVVAGEWLAGRTGVHTFEDVITGGPA